MKVSEAKQEVLNLITDDLTSLELPEIIDKNSPDGDEGKFLLLDKPARVIHPRDGFYVKINLDWFTGSTAMPEIRPGPFHWYVFALTNNPARGISAYFICDYNQMREWVLEFDAPLGNTHQDHNYWRGEIIINGDQGYFRWGDEPLHERKHSRYIQLRNISLLVGTNSATHIAELPSTPTTILDEIENLEHTFSELEDTERQAIIKSRLGQGKFRDRLINYWGGCAITASKSFVILRASHIKPWRNSDNQERLDQYNGLLLTPNFDAAFDAGLITFDDQGTIIVSSRVDNNERNLLGIHPDIKLRKIEEEHKEYLNHHRTHVFKP